MTGTTILLAEDDRFLRRAMEVALTRRGYRVICAGDGQEAIELLQTLRPDLVLLDLLMPRKTGIDVLRAVRQNPETATLRVLILSNSSKEQEINDAHTLGVAGYWIKANLSLQELSDKVAAVLQT